MTNIQPHDPPQTIDDVVAAAIALLASLTREDRLAVLRHFHNDLRSPEYLPDGGMNSGPMVRPVPSRLQP